MRKRKYPSSGNMGKKPYHCNLGCMRIISGFIRHDYPYRRWSGAVCRYDGEPSGVFPGPGEAFISGDISKDLLRFIKENKLGKVLPYQVQSGYGKYSAVAFDLEKLKAFNPKGVAEFRKEWNLPDKKPVKERAAGWSDEEISSPAAGGPALERNAPPLHILWKGGDENAGRSGKQDFNAGCQRNKVHRSVA